ncbi:MAG: Exodeoxyribonuclease 7 large subunit [Chlamydiae bacterium]|nr:Exodeoxyribonuclease 7 large subunit [Chlamydiota bacterium]
MEILSVTQLTLSIKNMLEPSFSSLQVKGEVSNVRHQASGHLYFSLKDQGAQISAVLFKGSARRVAQLPKVGDQIIVRGELSLYAPRGSYQIIVREVEHAGVGELLLKLHQLKEELKEKGWFSSELKKVLPKYPKTIGVVTSPTGSVIQDILHVLRRRFPQFHLILNPVRVQGVGAAKEIAAAIGDFNAHGLADILIVGRGGGSLEDLWPFNERCVAEAIFHSKIPVVSAVGHETDVTIADCVADVRAPTPSAAAEISVRELTSQLDFLRRVEGGIDQNLKQTIRHARARLDGAINQPLFSSPYTLLADHFQKVDDLAGDLDSSMRDRIERQELHLVGLKKQLQGLNPRAQVEQSRVQLRSYASSLQSNSEHQMRVLRGELDVLTDRLDSAQRAILEKKKVRFFSRDLTHSLNIATFKLYERKKRGLSYLTDHLKAVNPETILQKGYCIPFAEKDHSVMLSTHALKKGMRLSLRFHDGSALTRIEEVTPKDDGKKR